MVDPKKASELANVYTASDLVDADIRFGVDDAVNALSAQLSLAELKKVANVVTVANVAALYALTYAIDNQLYQTLGYTTEGIGANLYRYDSGSSATPDYGFTLDGIGGDGTGTGTGRFIALSREYADVLQFGVIPNDSTKSAANATAIGRAIAASTRVHFPWVPGSTQTFYYTTQVTLTAGKTLSGDSRDLVRLRPTSQMTTGSMLSIATYCTVRDIKLQGAPASGSVSTNSGLAVASASINWYVENVEVVQFGIGFDIVNSYVGTLHGCRAASCSVAGAKLSGAECNAINIIGGDYAQNLDGILLAGLCHTVNLKTTIEGNTAYGVHGAGAYVWQNLNIDGCYFEANTTHHIYIEAAGSMFGGSIANNSCHTATASHGFNVERCDGTVIGRSHFATAPTSGSHVNLGSATKNAIISQQVVGQQTTGTYGTIADAGENKYVDTKVVEIEASTVGSGAPNVLLRSESAKLLTNEGTTAANYHTLPTAVAGLTFTFVVQDADGLRITGATGDTIRLGNKVTATAGYIESTTIGDYVTVTAINDTEWIGVAYGTWTNGTWTFTVVTST